MRGHLCLDLTFEIRLKLIIHKCRKAPYLIVLPTWYFSESYLCIREDRHWYIYRLKDIIEMNYGNSISLDSCDIVCSLQEVVMVVSVKMDDADFIIEDDVICKKFNMQYLLNSVVNSQPWVLERKSVIIVFNFRTIFLQFGLWTLDFNHI